MNHSRTHSIDATTDSHTGRQTLAPIAAIVTLVAIASVLPTRAQARTEIKDRDIVSAIETNLLVNEEVSSHNIDIKAKDGIVTLSGSVYNILARDKATEIAESIRGVRSVVNEITVKPVLRSDAEIRGDVLDALATDPATDSYDIAVKVSHGEVTLSGKVDSYDEKKLCTEVTKGVRGVREVADQIKVHYKTKRPDKEIAEEVKALLRDDVLVHAELITVAVHSGKVGLSGTVPSAAEKTRAGEDAWVSGVSSVDDSDLKVEWFTTDNMQRKSAYVSRTDEEIEEAVHDALVQDPRVRSFDVKADSDYGVVTLTGMVDNLKASKVAQEDAQDTAGVWWVKNHLKVRPTAYPSDQEIISKVKAALKRDPYVDRHNIRVSAYNGKIYLYGTVDSEFEKLEAEDIALRVKGVIDIANYLDVREDLLWHSDWEIKKNIEDQLYWDTYVDAKNVDVSVQDGVVTLSGTVGTWHEYMEAAKDALRGGAKEVKNDLHMDHAPRM